MTRIPVTPERLTSGRERAGLDALALAGRSPKLGEWEAGELQPTLLPKLISGELRIANAERFLENLP